MRKIYFSLIFLFTFFTSPAMADFTWVWHGGDPRVKGGLPTAEAAQKWLLSGAGQNDYTRLEPDGLKPNLREEATVRVRNQGLETITIGRLGPGLVGSPIMGLTFGRKGTVIHGPIRIAWRNSSAPAIFYIPRGMRGLVPATSAVCGNTILVFIPPAVSRVVPPAPQAPPPPEFALDWQAFSTWGRTESRAISSVNQPVPLPPYIPPTQFEMNVNASANGGNPTANGGQATSSASSNPVATSTATGGTANSTNNNQNGNNNPISIGIGVNGTGTSSSSGTVNQNIR